jgi:nicotinate-nucleotide adenylyltransferase
MSRTTEPDKKVILFGGSFDPVHLGHIEILRYVHNHIGADKSIMIPARRSPLKKHGPVATNEQRLDMLRLASRHYEDIEVSDIEFKLAEPSFSYQTVCYFKNIYGDRTTLYWLCGADVIKELPRWYKIKEMFSMCRMILVCRGGYPLPEISALREYFNPETISMLRENMIRTPEIELSSTDIRNKLKNGQKPSDALDQAVYEYIINNGLYR